LLGELGVDFVVTHPFTHDLASMSAKDFITNLKSQFGLRYLYVGHDFALGHNREGDVTFLSQLGEEFDYRVEVIPPLEITGEVVSSSKIRAYLLAGDVKQANKLLGRPYRIKGEVVSGDGRGKTIGIPTANLSLWSKRAIPKAGVYACKAHVNGINWRAVTNIGVRPTFENGLATQRVETHILDFDKDIYGETIYLDFHSYIRSEQRFKDVDALIQQIRRDITTSRKILS
jgi:riboflavin kinase/FMN adenylyltransferase